MLNTFYRPPAEVDSKRAKLDYMEDEDDFDDDEEFEQVFTNQYSITNLLHIKLSNEFLSI